MDDTGKTESDKIGEIRQMDALVEAVERRFLARRSREIYGASDAEFLQGFGSGADPTVRLETLEELSAREAQRVKDGFPKQMTVRRIPTRQGGFVTVPAVEEEKLWHGRAEAEDDGDPTTGGEGEGEEGEVIGEQPVDREGAGDEEGDAGAGQGDGGDHDISQDAYRLGKELVEKFKLPNLADKGKKVRTNEYTYDLTDRYRGAGQKVDTKATMRRLIKINYPLGNIDPDNPDPSKLLVSRGDIVYRILSREQVEQSMAMVFFLRDYSGSMSGDPTQVVVNQHVLLYSWLLYQYEKLVKSKFIVHDTEAKEVPDFFTYYNLRIAGGTKIASGYRLINEIIDKENLARDYNIFIFQGTDGDDWDSEGKEAIPELQKLIDLPVARIGITVTRSGGSETEFEKYLKASGLLERKNLIRLRYVNTAEAVRDDDVNIQCIKHLISE